MDFIWGVVSGIVVTIGTLILQFRFSIAGKRFDRIENATRVVLSLLERGEDVASVRNKYRYSLGVTIDNLYTAYFSQNLPNLVDVSAGKMTDDRWEKFNKEIRPILNDLSPYLFMGQFPCCKFAILTRLLFDIEAYVGELDKAFQEGIIQVNQNMLSCQNLAGHPDLNRANQELLASWNAWKREFGY
jgi:hypothetical protein